VTEVTISSAAGFITIISTFTVEPARQEELVALLADHAERLLSSQPGFGGCALHASQDGTAVVNYALWRDADAIRTMLADPGVRQHARAVRSIAIGEPARYTVRHVIQAQTPPPAAFSLRGLFGSLGTTGLVAPEAGGHLRDL